MLFASCQRQGFEPDEDVKGLELDAVVLATSSLPFDDADFINAARRMRFCPRPAILNFGRGMPHRFQKTTGRSTRGQLVEGKRLTIRRIPPDQIS